MLDVHPPEHGISNAREFFIHLFTITCGLLIALGLENAAEAVRHRNERKEAIASIRRELLENREAILKNGPALDRERTALQAMLAFVEARSQGQEVPLPTHLDSQFSEGEIPDVAWRTASSTGVLQYMDYEQVERFAGAYREQELLQATEERTLNDILQLSSFGQSHRDPAHLSQQLATDSLPYMRRVLADLNGISAIGQGVLQAYQQALQ